ncbi:hypothetical protein BDZ45DRAFT_383796 [Acephala macrosclerotiorum]|nr:hypothetical protein BDZ45DRAFT_383796 [Acephala macrosclerotiorum]
MTGFAGGWICTASGLISLERSFVGFDLEKSGLAGLTGFEAEAFVFFLGESLTLLGAKAFLVLAAVEAGCLSLDAPLGTAISLVDLLPDLSCWSEDLFFSLSSSLTRVNLKSSGDGGTRDLSFSSSSRTLSFRFAPILTGTSALLVSERDSWLLSLVSTTIMLSFRFLLCSRLMERAGSKLTGSSTSAFLGLLGKSIFTGSSSTNCDTGGGPISGESVVSTLASAARLSISWRLCSVSIYSQRKKKEGMYSRVLLGYVLFSRIGGRRPS